MRVYALPPGEDWIVDRMVDEWFEGNQDIAVNRPSEADVIWLLADWAWDKVSPFDLQSKRVVTTVHHIVPEKFGHAQKRDFYVRDTVTNLYHCFNERTAEFIRRLTSKPIVVTRYWYNDEFWTPPDVVGTETEAMLVAREVLNLNLDEYIVGSFQRDTEGHDLKSPKLEKGPDLFCDAVEHIVKESLTPEKVRVLLGGWRRQYIMNRLDSVGIGYTYIERPPLETIRTMYRACSIYLVTARHEGGPQSILEAAAMRVPIVSTPVGIAEQVLAPESIHENVVYADPNIGVAYNNVRTMRRELMWPQYRKMFEQCLNG